MPLEACAAESLDLLVAVLLSADPGVMTSGETAMVTRGKSEQRTCIIT